MDESTRSSHTLGNIADHIGGDVVGDRTTQISGLASLESAGEHQLSHLSSPAYKQYLQGTGAAAVILHEKDLAECPCAAIVVAQPYLAFALASQLFAKRLPGAPGVHPSAVVHESVEVPDSAHIGPNAVIGAHTRLHDNVWLAANASVGERCVLGAGVQIHANATLHADVKVGEQTVVHSGAVIGASGFGFTPGPDGHLVEIAQLGGVTIGSHVSVGANTTIDCGAIEDTVIEEGVKIDNQVQIAHNCHIGAHSLICGMVGMVGSTRIGRHCVLAGGVGVGGDKPIELCDGVILSACTHVTQSITEPGVYSGTTLFQPHGQWRRNAMRQSQLDSLFKRVRKLEKHVNPGDRGGES